MQTSGFKCDHHQCHAVSNGTLDGWYAVRVSGEGVYRGVHIWPLAQFLEMLAEDDKREITWQDLDKVQHECGISHALSAAREALESITGSVTGNVPEVAP